MAGAMMQTRAVVAAMCDEVSLCDVSLLLAVRVEGPAASMGRGAYSGMCQCKFVGIGTGGSHCYLDAA